MNVSDMVEQARKRQMEYWSPNGSEKRQLLAENFDHLPWEKSLRLLHLVCLDLISEGSGKDELASDEPVGVAAAAGEDHDLVVKLLSRLRSAESPYCERHVSVWKGKPGEANEGEPEVQGILANASLTHLGSIEVIRLNVQNEPIGVSFVALDEIRGVVLAPPALFRAAKLFFDSQRPDELVLLPLLYGISWRSPNAFDRDGTMTRFICHINSGNSQSSLSIGVGHQDLIVNQGESQSLIGLGTVNELMIGLTLSDPKFEEKCRARGVDPAEARRLSGSS